MGARNPQLSIHPFSYFRAVADKANNRYIGFRPLPHGRVLPEKLRRRVEPPSPVTYAPILVIDRVGMRFPTLASSVRILCLKFREIKRYRLNGLVEFAEAC